MKKRIQKGSRSGFTMVEVIVVCVILGILLAAGTGAIIQYRKYSMFKQNNEYAKTIFAAAQSSLSYYKSGGKLEELVQKPEVQNQTVGDVGGGAPQGLHYLEITQDQITKEDNFLYQLLKDYIYDSSIFNAAIRLEFNPSSGAVYSVCYSNRTDRFSEDTLEAQHTDEVFGVSGRDDWDSLRKKYILGYYNADMDGTPVQEAEKVIVKKVWWDNQDVLELIWDLDCQKDVSQYSYQAELFESDTDSVPAVTLEFDGKTMTGESASAGNQIECQWKEQNLTLPFRIYQQNREVHMTIDAIDLQAARVSEEEAGQTAEAYQQTYSVKRLNLSGLTVARAQITVLGKNVQTGCTGRTQQPENLYMGTASAGHQYSILNPRHLYNLRFMTDSAAVFSLDQDLIWAAEGGTAAKGYVYDQTGNTSNAAFPAIPTLSKDCRLEGNGKTVSDFVWTAALQKDQSAEAAGLFCENEGTIQNITLKNVSLDDRIEIEKGSYLCGENEGTIQKVTIANSIQQQDIVKAEIFGGIAAESEKPLIECAVTASFWNQAQWESTGGLVGEMEGAFQKCTFDGSIKLSSSKDQKGTAGSLAGVMKAELADVYNDAGKKTEVVLEAVDGTIGGLIGSMEASARQINNDRENETVTLKLGDAATGGGLFGAFGSDQAVVMGDCLTWETWTITGGNRIGGLIGEARQEVTVRGSRNSAKLQTATVQGGLIASWQGTGTIENCANVADLEPGQDHGGIVGNIDGGEVTIDHCRNYGKPADVDEDEWANANLSGIVANMPNGGRGRVINCYGVSDMLYPIASDQLSRLSEDPEQPNFYFVEKSEEAEFEPGNEIWRMGKSAMNWAAGIQFNMAAYVSDDNASTAAVFGTQETWLQVEVQDANGAFQYITIDWMGKNRTYEYTINMYGKEIYRNTVTVRSDTGHYEDRIALEVPFDVSISQSMQINIKMSGSDDLKYADPVYGSGYRNYDVGDLPGIWEIRVFAPKAKNRAAAYSSQDEIRPSLGQALWIRQVEGQPTFEGVYRPETEMEYRHRAVGMECSPHENDNGYQVYKKVDPYLYTGETIEPFPDERPVISLEKPDSAQLSLTVDGVTDWSDKNYAEDEYGSIPFRFNMAGEGEYQLQYWQSAGNGEQPSETSTLVGMDGGSYTAFFSYDPERPYLQARVRRVSADQTSEWSDIRVYTMPAGRMNTPELQLVSKNGQAAIRWEAGKASYQIQLTDHSYGSSYYLEAHPLSQNGAYQILDYERDPDGAAYEFILKSAGQVVPLNDSYMEAGNYSLSMSFEQEQDAQGQWQEYLYLYLPDNDSVWYTGSAIVKTMGESGWQSSLRKQWVRLMGNGLWGIRELAKEEPIDAPWSDGTAVWKK